MDQTTVIILTLAVHLVCSSALYWLIGRTMPSRSGVNRWAVGALLFGLAYGGRLVAGAAPAWPAMLALDAAMVLAALLFLTGLREFLGKPAGPGWLLPGFVLLFAVWHGLGVWALGVTGRHQALNLVLGAIYGAIAVEAWLACNRQPPALRPPLRMMTLMMGSLALPTLARGALIAVVGPDMLYRGLFSQLYYGYASLASVMLGLNLVWLVFARLNTQLAELASRDALTRLLNRNGLDEVITRHFAAREPRSLTLLQVDIDHFKRINDSLGHAAGDRVLCEVAAALAGSVRASDFIARTGGEEFLVGCVAADDGVAWALAERLLGAVRRLDIKAPGAKLPLHCTVSIGISGRCGRKADWERCWAEADRALYAAKAAGRDRVVAASALRADLR